jgi:hypothetical protein
MPSQKRVLLKHLGLSSFRGPTEEGSLLPGRLVIQREMPERCRLAQHARLVPTMPTLLT